MTDILIIILTFTLTSNCILAQFLGICPFLGVSKKLDSAVGMGVAVIFVMVLATAVTWPIQMYILNPNGLAYLQTIVFILVIACLVQFVEMFLKKAMPPLYNALGVWSSNPFYFPTRWEQANSEQRNTSFSCLLVRSSNLLVGSNYQEGLWFGYTSLLNQISGATSTYSFNTVYYANSLYQAGSKNHGLWWSDDPSASNAFTQATGIPSTATVYSVHYANGIWVSTTSEGMFWSSDGKAWVAVTGTNSHSFKNAEFHDGMWLAVTDNDGIWWSTDGKYWTKATGELTSSYASIAYKSGMWAIAGSSGIAYSNYDAIAKYFADGGIL